MCPGAPVAEHLRCRRVADKGQQQQNRARPHRAGVQIRSERHPDAGGGGGGLLYLQVLSQQPMK